MTEPLLAKDVLLLEGWVTLVEAADQMQLSTNGLRKRVFDYNEFGVENVRRIPMGTNTIYLLRKEVVDAKVKIELAEREDFQANRQPLIILRRARREQRERIIAWAKQNNYTPPDGKQIKNMGRLPDAMQQAYFAATGEKPIE